MRSAKAGIAALLAVASVTGQAGQTQAGQGKGGVVPLARIAPFAFGAPVPANRTPNLGRALFNNPFGAGIRTGAVGNSGPYRASPYGSGLANGYLLSPGFGGLNGYYYWTPQSQVRQVPAGPSYANPAAVRAVGDLPAALVAPERPGASEEWADARSSFTAASAKVSSARRSVEELRARLESLGQSPRANIVSNMANAEAALKSAQDQMSAGNLGASLTEIQRANYIAAQVLKEFGR
ncbi:MAG: hypothetical protein ABI995_13640 [Acidobacteriota bacterium]